MRIVGRASDQVDTDHIRQAIIDHPSVSNRELARMLKCSPTTVGKYRDQIPERHKRKMRRSPENVVQLRFPEMDDDGHGQAL